MSAEPVLADSERAALEKGVREFNDGFYFECHDTLEEMWSGLRGPARDFFQGLIQVSVAFYHLGNGNLAGAQSLLGRALARLARYPDHYFGFDVARHRAELSDWRARVAAADAVALAGPRPRWSFDWMEAG